MAANNRIRKNHKGLEIEVEVLLVKVGAYWVSYAPSLKLSSYGPTQAAAKKGLADVFLVTLEHLTNRALMSSIA